VKRVRPGAYQAVLDSAHAANGHVSERWLTPELLQQLAEDTGSRFVANHPGAADHDDLVADAKRRVEVWIERHDGGEPDNEAHLRRLMKTALDDYYRRLRRNGSKPGTNVGVEEVRLR
jgi:predicted Rdx family selenoprotein